MILSISTVKSAMWSSSCFWRIIIQSPRRTLRVPVYRNMAGLTVGLCRIRCVSLTLVSSPIVTNRCRPTSSGLYQRHSQLRTPLQHGSTARRPRAPSRIVSPGWCSPSMQQRPVIRRSKTSRNSPSTSRLLRLAPRCPPPSLQPHMEPRLCMIIPQPPPHPTMHPHLCIPLIPQ